MLFKETRVQTAVLSSQQIPDSTSYTLVYIEAIILGMLAAGMPAYFAMDHTQDREVMTWEDELFVCFFCHMASFDMLVALFSLKIKCRSTLRISGLIPSAYWCGQAAVDIPFCYLILSCMTAVLFSLHTEDMLTSSNLTAVVRYCYQLSVHQVIKVSGLLPSKDQTSTSNLI